MCIQYKVNVSENQVDTLKDAIRLNHVLLFTPAQINRLDKAQEEVRRAHIRMSARQVAKNVSYVGGFLDLLASLAARAIPLAACALPTILSRLTAGLLSGGINKAISDSGDG